MGVYLCLHCLQVFFCVASEMRLDISKCWRASCDAAVNSSGHRVFFCRHGEAMSFKSGRLSRDLLASLQGAPAARGAFHASTKALAVCRCAAGALGSELSLSAASLGRPVDGAGAALALQVLPSKTSRSVSNPKTFAVAFEF